MSNDPIREDTLRDVAEWLDIESGALLADHAQSGEYMRGVYAMRGAIQRCIDAEPAALAHHETHRSREIHPLALAYLEASVRVFSERFNWTGTPTPAQEAREDALGEWVRDGLKLYAATDSVPQPAEQATSRNTPDPHHEADAALGRALREAREAWGGAPLVTTTATFTKTGREWVVWANGEPVAQGPTELEALQAAIAAASARRDLKPR